MIESILFGFGLAFAAGVQPGPLQAFLFSQVVQKGWRHTLPAAMAPLLSDGPIAVLMLLVIGKLPPGAGRILQITGGLLLLYLSVKAFAEWRRGQRARTADRRSVPRTLFQAVLVNLANPGPYLGWSLVLGPAVLQAWHQAPAHAVALVAAFYATLVATIALTIVLFGGTGFLGSRAKRALALASGATLALLGIYRIASGLR